METKDPRAVLEQLIVQRREDYAGLSRLIGRNPAYIQQFIKRGTPKRLSERDRNILARYFQIDESLLGGPALPTELGSKGLVAIPRYDVRASAGSGSFFQGDRPMAPIAFDPAWLRQISASNWQDLSIIQVRGDSMHPTLSDGDDIMVDRSAAVSALHDGVYVLRRDDALSVKRVAVHPGTRLLTISSDNRSYPTWPGCEPASVEILGRVIWAGRRFK